jgi:hypothetical protein
MKKLIVLFVLLQNLAFGQYQTLFGNTSATWKMVKSTPFFGYDNYQVTLDSVINVNGEMIYRVKDHSISGTCSNQNFIKEDLVNGKFYYSGNINGNYVLFMDLGLQIGDTSPTFWFYSPTGTVDSIYLDNQNRKHIRFSSSVQISEHYEFIEGVGSSRGIPLNCASSPGLSPTFICKEKDNVIEYSSISTNPYLIIDNCFMYILGIDEQVESFYQLSPNPGNDEIMITIPEGEVMQKITVLNALGQEVYQLDKPKNKLDVSGLDAGIYTIKIEVKNKSYAKRFVKL